MTIGKATQAATLSQAPLPGKIDRPKQTEEEFKKEVVTSFLKGAEPANILAQFPATPPHLETGQAQYELGLTYVHDRKENGVVEPANPHEAIWLFINAAVNGNGRAYYHLGSIVSNNHAPFKMDDANKRALLALEWFKESADLEFPRGEFIYGRMLYEGVGTQDGQPILQQQAKGIEYLGRARDHNDHHAALYLLHRPKVRELLAESRRQSTVPSQYTND